MGEHGERGGGVQAQAVSCKALVSQTPLLQGNVRMCCHGNRFTGVAMAIGRVRVNSKGCIRLCGECVC